MGSAETIQNGQAARMQGADSGLPIGRGDLLDISVYGAPDYVHEVRVSEDGSISLPLVGTVQVAGLTSLELSKTLHGKLSDGGYFNDPQVSVFVKEYATQGISVLGEVQKPGIYPLLGPRTLFDAISAAGGTTQVAGDNATITHRNQGKTESVKLAYNQKGVVQSNIRVFPGDTIIVERAGLAYVIGAVTKPTEIVMSNPNLTVLQALAIAQGPTGDASLNKAKLVRTIAGVRNETPLELKKMLTGKVADVKLQPNDIIFVPGNITKSAAKKGLGAAVQTLSGLAVYGRY